MNKYFLSIIILLSCVVLYPPISESRSKFLIDEVVYLKANIHYQAKGDDNETSYACWVGPIGGHKIMPVNTPVKIKKWGRENFKILSILDDVEIEFEFNRERMKMPRDEYLKYIISSVQVPLERFSDLDRKGIMEGKAYIGMTKEGVFTALGYPPTHRTPSLKSNTWVYWRDPRRTTSVTFDQEGIAARMRG